MIHCWKTYISLCLLLILSQTSQARDPKINYMMECQGCHLADGSGGLDNIPPLNNHVAKFLSVEGGREFLVRVPGVAQAPLSDEETTAVINWMLREFGPVDIANQYPPYTVKEVAHWRRQPLDEIDAEREKLIAAIKAQEQTAP